MKFHDGEAFDAEAAKFSLDRHMTMQGSFRRPELAVVDKVTVVDPMTIRLDLKAPFAPLIAQLTDPRRHDGLAQGGAGRPATSSRRTPVCAGPYRFFERVQQDRIVVQKFADYWDKDNVHIDRITYLPIADSTVRLANLRSGQLDLIERALATDIKEIRGNNRLKLATALELGYQGMTLNVGKGDAGKLFGDKRVRQALEASIDRAAINQVVFNGEFTPGNQWVNPQNSYYQGKFPVPGRDVAKAKKLIAESGVKTPIQVDFMVPNNPETRQVAEVIQAMAAEAGFDMKIRVTEFATSLTEAENGRYQALPDRLVRPHRSGRQHLFLRQDGPGAELLGLQRPHGRCRARRGADEDLHGRAQGGLREGDREAGRGRRHRLPLPPPRHHCA